MGVCRFWGEIGVGHRARGYGSHGGGPGAGVRTIRGTNRLPSWPPRGLWRRTRSGAGGSSRGFGPLSRLPRGAPGGALAGPRCEGPDGVAPAARAPNQAMPPSGVIVGARASPSIAPHRPPAGSAMTRRPDRGCPAPAGYRCGWIAQPKADTARRKRITALSLQALPWALVPRIVGCYNPSGGASARTRHAPAPLGDSADSRRDAAWLGRGPRGEGRPGAP